MVRRRRVIYIVRANIRNLNFAFYRKEENKFVKPTIFILVNQNKQFFYLRFRFNVSASAQREFSISISATGENE